MDNVRIQKAERLVQKELSVIFQQNESIFAPGSLINVTVVRMSADLSLAKVYLSIYHPQKKAEEIFHVINDNKKQIRHALAQRIKNKVKSIPELAFFIDDSYEYSKRIEELLKK
ncbi:MAG: 30S ribosome-binding factor RbfA [Bacteroidales bacterium]|nr:30S ribosome-binding factor RbfA [Bacteroidales bacterium]